MKGPVFSVFILMVCFTGWAQDVHWSQPYNALLYQNPAFTGISSRFSANINYRNQWSALNSAFKSYQVGADYRFGRSEPKHVALSLGALIVNDVAGEGKLRTNSGGLSFSCLIKAGARSRFGLGVGFNRAKNSVQSANFSWGSQFDGNEYNPAIRSGETETLEYASYSDLSAGISFALDERSRSRSLGGSVQLVMGYSVSHLNQPELAISGGSQKLAIKHTFYLQGLVPLKDNFSWRPLLLAYNQSMMLEFSIGSLFRYSLAQQSRITGIRKNSSFSFGALFRYNDAFVPIIEFEKKGMTFALSYDLNISKLSNVSNLRGGFEIGIRFNAATYLYNAKPRGGKGR